MRSVLMKKKKKKAIKTLALASVSLGVTIMKRKKSYFKILLTSDVYYKANSFHFAKENTACEASF
jgi:hypothetical protein